MLTFASHFKEELTDENNVENGPYMRLCCKGRLLPLPGSLHLRRTYFTALHVPFHRLAGFCKNHPFVLSSNVSTPSRSTIWAIEHNDDTYWNNSVSLRRFCNQQNCKFEQFSIILFQMDDNRFRVYLCARCRVGKRHKNLFLINHPVWHITLFFLFGNFGCFWWRTKGRRWWRWGDLGV